MMLLQLSKAVVALLSLGFNNCKKISFSCCFFACLQTTKDDLLLTDFEGALKFFRVQLPKRYRSEENAKKLMELACNMKVSWEGLLPLSLGAAPAPRASTTSLAVITEIHLQSNTLTWFKGSFSLIFPRGILCSVSVEVHNFPGVLTFQAFCDPGGVAV